MKRALFAGCLAVMMLLSLGAVLLTPDALADGTSSQETWHSAPEKQAQEISETAQTADVEPVQTFDEGCLISMRNGDAVTELPLSDYLCGVVLAEMPPSFEPAALEAQAIAARTFVLKQSQNSKHENADVCADGACCQQYLSPQRAKEKLGGQFTQYDDKIRQAVEHTDGLVITYQGELIDAVYFSCSGGATEDAVAVWGGDVPYLQSVESPGEEISSKYTDSTSVQVTAFRDKILSAYPHAVLTGEPAGWFGAAVHSAGGGVQTLEIGGVSIPGTELRSMFSLRSTWFTISLEGDSIVFATRGYGHRVGMSQYGAQAMALEGADAAKILQHYYTGVELTQMA